MQTQDSNNYRLCIIGSGGFGREVLCLYLDILNQLKIDYKDKIIFAVEESFRDVESVMGFPVFDLSNVDFNSYTAVIAISDNAARRKIAEQLPADVRFATLIHPSATLSQWVDIGIGSVICAGSILTCNIKIGIHAHINLGTKIGHDFLAGDYLTVAPGAAISGNCTLGNNVFIGSNASIKERLTITNNVTIGMGAVIVKEISEAGTYVGNPAQKR